jgi:hypothetical protein
MTDTIDQFRYFLLLFETRDAHFYHGTRANAVNAMLNDNYMYSGTDIDTYDPEMDDRYEKQGHEGTISVSRDLLTAKKYSMEDYWHGDDNDEYDLPCVIVLNQPSLRQDLGKRIRPADRQQGGYTEEKIYGGIKNIRKYIVSILIYNSDSLEDEYHSKEERVENFLNSHKWIKRMMDSGTAKFVK